MTIQLLDSHFPWLARHGGFAQLPDALRLIGCRTDVIAPRKSLFRRVAGKIYSTFKGHPKRDYWTAASECEFFLRMQFSGGAGHVLFLEDHLPYLDAPTSRLNWIGTIHLPRRCWSSSSLDRLRRFGAITVLCDYMADQFSDILNGVGVRVLHHGVDANFFRPAADLDESRPTRLMFVGAWLRNTKMLARIVPEILRKFPAVRFDFVVPLHARSNEAIDSLLDHPAIDWHQNLSDEDLRSLYQNAVALLLPMEDSGANNSVLEGLACGVPIVTTDVGGIRSYGGGNIFPVVDNNDDAGFLDLVAGYLTDAGFRSSVSRQCREFAETKLNWPIAAQEYISAYQAFGLL